jgi:hypothetical protein
MSISLQEASSQNRFFQLAEKSFSFPQRWLVFENLELGADILHLKNIRFILT